MLLINCLIFFFLGVAFRYNHERRKADIKNCEYNDDKGYVNLSLFCEINVY